MNKRAIALIALVVVTASVATLIYLNLTPNRYLDLTNTAPPAPFTFTGSVNLMDFHTRFSLIGGKGPSLAYPVSEVYSVNNSLLASTFLWNMKSSEGVVNMTFYHNEVKVWVNLTDFQKIQTNIPVDGYPDLMYGSEGWFPFYGSTIMLPQLRLPMKLSSLPQFYSEVDFRLFKVRGTIDDFSYDIWLSQNPNVTYLQYPCIEVMVWMYHEEGIPSSYFVKVGDLSVEAVINGTVRNVSFTVYVLPHTGSPNGWIGVYYVSDQQLEGNVSLPLSYMIKQSVYFASEVFPNLSPDQYYLDAIQVGMEFNNDSQGVAQLGYELYGWRLYFNYTPGSM